MNIEDRASIQLSKKNLLSGNSNFSTNTLEISPDGQTSNFQLEMENLNTSPGAHDEKKLNFPNAYISARENFGLEQSKLHQSNLNMVESEPDNQKVFDAKFPDKLEHTSPSPSMTVGNHPVSESTNIVDSVPHQAVGTEQIGVTQDKPHPASADIKVMSGDSKISPAYLAQVRLSDSSVYKEIATINVASTAANSDGNLNNIAIQNFAKSAPNQPVNPVDSKQFADGTKIKSVQVANHRNLPTKSNENAAPKNLVSSDKPSTANITPVFNRPVEQIQASNGTALQVNSKNLTSDAVLKVTNSEAHYASVQSPAYQIFERIQHHLADSIIRTSNTDEVAGFRPATSQSIGTLAIKLTPDNLGTVDIVIKLLGDKMSINIQTSNVEAELKLRSDSGLMVKLLKESGFVLETYEIVTNSQMEASGDYKRRDIAISLFEDGYDNNQYDFDDTDNRDNKFNKLSGQKDENSTGHSPDKSKKFDENDGRIGVYI